MTKKHYANYFNSHYKLKFNKKFVETYRNWLYAQWEYINKLTVINSTAKVLEIGSGIGTVYSFLKDRNIVNYVGLEMDKDAVKFCNSFFKTKNFKNTAFENYSDKTKRDIIFAFEVLEHLDSPIVSIGNIYKKLTNGGMFIGTSPFPYPKNIYADETHKYVLHPENWKKIFMDAGFKSVEVKAMSFLPYVWRINKRLNILLPFYIGINYFISTTLIIAKK